MSSRQKRQRSAALQQNEIIKYIPRLSHVGISSNPMIINLLRKKSITELWPIQSVAYRIILSGKDVVVRAKAGSGKTYTYLLCMVCKCFRWQYPPPHRSPNLAPRVMIILPETDSCEKVHATLMNLIDFVGGRVRVALWTHMYSPEEAVSQAGYPAIVVSTPYLVLSYIKHGILKIENLEKCLRTLILDEVDVPLSHSYEEDIKSLLSCIPKACQCALFSESPSADLNILRKLVPHNPRIVTLTEEGSVKKELFPYNVEQFYVSCAEEDKLVYLLNILYMLRKALVFTNSNDVGCRVKAFLEKCGRKGEVLRSDLDLSYNEQLLEDLDAGCLNFLIAVDDDQSMVDYKNEKRFKRGKKKGFGMIEGINFKKVHQVVNFNMPRSVSGYFWRIVHAGRPNDIGLSYSLVSPSEMRIIEGIKSFVGDDPGKDSKVIVPEFSSCPKEKIYQHFVEDCGPDALSWMHS